MRKCSQGILFKERVILNDDDRGRNRQGVKIKSYEMENEIKNV